MVFKFAWLYVLVSNLELKPLSCNFKVVRLQRRFYYGLCQLGFSEGIPVNKKMLLLDLYLHSVVTSCSCLRLPCESVNAWFRTCHEIIIDPVPGPSAHSRLNISLEFYITLLVCFTFTVLIIDFFLHICFVNRNMQIMRKYICDEKYSQNFGRKILTYEGKKHNLLYLGLDAQT